jgi:PAS domain S-box-containing protein
VCESDGDRFVLVNNAFCDLFGYGREQVVGRSALELQLWTRAPAREELVQRLRAGESVQALEGAARRGDGRAVDVQFSAERIEFGGQEALLLMFRDISERKRLDAALRTSQARLAHLLARAPTVVYTARAEGDFAATYYSPNLPALLGWQPLNFVADSSFWLNHVHPDDRDAVLHEMAALPTRDELVLEYRFEHADGRWRWMRDQVSVQRDEQGAATELVGAWIDITERREAEEQVRRLATELEERVQERTAQLAQSEARYRTIFETVPISIGEEDWSEVQHLLRDLRRQGVSDGPGYFAERPDFVHDCLRAVKVRRLNRKALALHDARDQQTDLPDLQAVYPRPEDLPQFVGELEAMWAGQCLLTAKRSLPSVTGRPLRLMMTMSLPALDDTDGTALVCLVDITEIDRLNAELDRSVARLREVNRELETFTYSVSHDLKAPLRGIDGYSRLLLAEHAERLDDEGRQFLAHIRQATQHMGTLIDDLLAYSRLERRALALAPLALGPLVDAALAGLRGELEAAGAQLELALDPALRLRGDAQGLTMALRNLVDNALKFSRQRTPPRIRLTATQTRGGVAVSVVDNGVGFDMKFHDRIFAIFQRLHRAEDYPGTGVGLAIVRKAVERMGGRVWASSQPGEGACFTIELPEADAP